MNIKRSHKLSVKLTVGLTALLFLSLGLILTSTIATGLANEAPQGLQPVTARAQASTGADVPLAGVEEWVQASVEIDNAPDGAIVSSVQVKYHVVYSEPSELEVQLLTSGTEAAYTLWNKESAAGAVLTQSTEAIAAFEGAPVNGTWSLAVQGGDPEGYIDDFSVIVYYEMEMPVLQIEGEGTPGTPGFLRLPEGATPASLPPDNDEKPSGEGSSVVPQDVPPGAIIFKAENFEGAFPNGLWYPFDNSPDGYERYWDDAGCDPCGGDWAMWPADGGADGIYPCTPNNYPNNMGTWAVYGPFDLSDPNYVDAGTEFVMWHEIEPSFDWVFFGYSGDGYNFTGWFFDGYNDCTIWNAYYPSMLGDPSVYVAWVFGSDPSVTYRGPWVDDIVIWAEPSVQDCATLKVEPPETFTNANSTFFLDVTIEDAIDLGAFEFELTYDSTCIEATAVNLGPFLGSTGRGVGEVGPTFAPGSVAYGGYSWGANPGPNGNGVLATVTFQTGPNSCDTAVVLQNVSVTDTAGNPQCIDWLEGGVVHVTSCPHPNCPEDINCDGVVNIVDIMLVASKWGQTCPTRP